jgi:hypothetical protein
MANFFDQFDQAATAAPAGKNFFDQFDQPPAEPVSANNVARSAATGVMIGGGLLNKLDAATNAVLAPVVEPFMKKGPDSINDEPGSTWEERLGNRYRKSFDIQEGMDKKFAADHPVLDTVAKIGGGVAATIPLAGTTTGAKILGLTGETLPLQIRNGVLSGAALGGADAAVRGEDWKTGALTGGAVGGVVPAVAQGVGKVASSVMNKLRPEPVIPQNTVRIGSTDIPLSESQVTGSPAASAEEQILLRGGRGDKALEVAQGAQDLQEQRINQAKDEVGATLDPSGNNAATTPQIAGERVAGELGQAEQARQAVRALQDGSLDFERENIGTGLDPSRQRISTTPDQAGEVVANAARQQATQATALADQQAELLARNREATRLNLAGGPIADDAHHAAEIISDSAQQAAEAARARTTAAYNAMRDEPGEFNPAAFNRMGQSIRQRLSAGDNPVHVNPTTTPMAAQALRELDQNISGINRAAPQQTLRLADGRIVPAPRPITGTTIDEARKNLVIMASDARAASLRTGNQSDVRAMRRVIDAFEGHVSDAVNAGAFSGNGQRLLQLQNTARGLHSAYRQTFTSQGGGDKVGKVIEEIVGRRGIDPAPTPRVAQVMYGSEAKPGGAQAVQVAQRLRNIFGENSPQWGAYKQGLFSHVTENAAGRAPGEIADRINSFLGDTHSRALAQVAFNPEERLALQQYAQHARSRVPEARAATDKVGQALERIVGEGGQPATPNGVADTLFGKSGIGDQEISAKLAQHVRDTHGQNSPEFSAVRQGMWHSLTQAPGGKLDLNPGKIADRIAEHVNGRGKSTADVLFSPGEKKQMLDYAGKLRASAPKDGDEVDKVVARITGRDGGLPASPTEVADFLYGRSGAGDKGISVKLAQRLKRQLSPDGWTSVRQGMWTKLTEPAEGRLDWGPQKIAERMHEFLNGNGAPLSHVLFSPEERGLMKKLAGVYKQMIPVKGTTNPSGTAPMLAKIANGARHTLLPLLGFTHGGIPGAAVAYGMDKAFNALGNAKAARNATKLFYGKQPDRFASLPSAIARKASAAARGLTPELTD